MSYVFSNDELQSHMNTAFLNTLHALCKEKYITAKQRDEIGTDYAIIIESRTWLPKKLADWLGLKDGRVHYRLVKVIGRCKKSGEDECE